MRITAHVYCKLVPERLLHGVNWGGSGTWFVVNLSRFTPHTAGRAAPVLSLCSMAGIPIYRSMHYFYGGKRQSQATDVPDISISMGFYHLGII